MSKNPSPWGLNDGKIVNWFDYPSSVFLGTIVTLI